MLNQRIGGGRMQVLSGRRFSFIGGPRSRSGRKPKEVVPHLSLHAGRRFQSGEGEPSGCEIQEAELRLTTPLGDAGTGGGKKPLRAMAAGGGPIHVLAQPRAEYGIAFGVLLRRDRKSTR